MITKAQFCNYIIDSFCETEGIDRKEIQDHLGKSSSACVAAEYLGLITNSWLKKYAESRAGVHLYIGGRDPGILTTRELLDFLPE